MASVRLTEAVDFVSAYRRLKSSIGSTRSSSETGSSPSASFSVVRRLPSLFGLLLRRNRLRRAAYEREGVDRHAIPLPSVHYIEPPRMLTPRAALAPFRFALLEDCHVQFLSGRRRLSASFQPSEQRRWPNPDAARAVAQHIELTSDVGPANRLLATADAFGCCADGEQLLRTSAGHPRSLGERCCWF